MSTEVRKIEGWSVELDMDPDRFTFYPGGEQPNFPPPQYTVTHAVLVVGSKVVYTEEEVKAILRRIKRAFPLWESTITEEVNRVAREEGITL